MENQQIEAIVRAVLGELAQKQTAVSPAVVASVAKSMVTDEDALPDLGSDGVKQNIGVKNPLHQEVLQELKKVTGSRVAVGRCGTRPRTQALLRFWADHSRSKDTVLQEISPEWVAKTGLIEVQTQIDNKDQYLTRPDLGRKLSDAAIATLKEKCVMAPQVQVVVSDGLSTEALTANYDELLPPLLKGLNNAGLKVGTPFFLRYGRVKAEDQIGELLKAEVVILLIGERPGLGQSESLSCYMVYQPSVATTVEADRNCISNIHQQGTPPVEAAAVIVELAQKMLKHKASGISLVQKGG